MASVMLLSPSLLDFEVKKLETVPPRLAIDLSTLVLCGPRNVCTVQGGIKASSQHSEGSNEPNEVITPLF